jgi:membrane protein DedA with SNARE-associated domain
VTSLIDQIRHHGALFVFVNVLAQQLGAPVPSEPSLIVAASQAASGRLRLSELFAAAIAGMLLANAAWYLLGRHYGGRLLALAPRLLASRLVRIGPRSIALSKLIPGIGIVVPPLAGATHYGFWRFLGYDLLAATLWSGAGIGAGFFLHDQVNALLHLLDDLRWAVLAVPAVLVAAWLVFRRARRSRRAQVLAGSSMTAVVPPMPPARGSNRSVPP